MRTIFVLSFALCFVGVTAPTATDGSAEVASALLDEPGAAYPVRLVVETTPAATSTPATPRPTTSAPSTAPPTSTPQPSATTRPAETAAIVTGTPEPSETPEETPAPTPDPTPKPTPEPTPKPTPKPTPEPNDDLEKRCNESSVARAICRAWPGTAQDEKALDVAWCESSHNPKAYNPGVPKENRGPWYGLWQFSKQSWKDAGGPGNDPRDYSAYRQTRVAHNWWQIRGWSAWSCA